MLLLELCQTWFFMVIRGDRYVLKVGYQRSRSQGQDVKLIIHAAFVLVVGGLDLRPPKQMQQDFKLSILAAYVLAVRGQGQRAKTLNCQSLLHMFQQSEVKGQDQEHKM